MCANWCCIRWGWATRTPPWQDGALPRPCFPPTHSSFLLSVALACLLSIPTAFGQVRAGSGPAALRVLMAGAHQTRGEGSVRRHFRRSCRGSGGRAGTVPAVWTCATCLGCPRMRRCSSSPYMRAVPLPRHQSVFHRFCIATRVPHLNCYDEAYIMGVGTNRHDLGDL